MELIFFFLFFFFAAPCSMQDLSFLTTDQTCAPLKWESRVLTTEPPGKFQGYDLKLLFLPPIDFPSLPS